MLELIRKPSVQRESGCTVGFGRTVDKPYAKSAGCDGEPFNSDTWEAARVGEGKGGKEVKKKALTTSGF